ncbi:MAG: transglutaminase domain-containing protein [Lachnospiraceae bacterium]|nr:transglutaminase domain-containing protein [Lachnospiraceae bacterium]
MGAVISSVCRILFFYVGAETVNWLFPDILLLPAVMLACAQEVFLFFLWRGRERKVGLAGFLLGELVLLVLFRESEVFWAFLFAIAAFPLTHLLYRRDPKELKAESYSLSAKGSLCREKLARRLLRFLPALLFLGTLIFRFTTENPGKSAVLPTLLLLAVEACRFLEGRTGLRRTPAWLLLFLVIAVLPVQDKPLDWSFVKKFIEEAEKKIETMLMDLSYLTGGKENVTGYSGLGVIGDNVGGSDKPELSLSERNTSGRIYLKGAVYTKWDGDRWTLREEEDPYLLWVADFLKALHAQGIAREEADCFSEIQNTKVTYAYLKTKDLMRPLTLLRIMDKSGKRELSPGPGFTAEETLEKGDSYFLRYLDVDFGSPLLRDIIRKAAERPEKEELSYKELDQYCQSLYGSSLPELLEGEAYAPGVRPDEAGSPYLDLTGITDRMRALSEEITKDRETAYDAALAVEQYLRQYTYSTHPKTGDIERFLFEEQEGYCVHFASSMVLLLRAAGIPARFCEGYLYRYRDKDPEQGYVVSSKDAHAWAEAYISGFGWVPFEPTPAAYSSERTTWGRTPYLPTDAHPETGVLPEAATVLEIPEAAEPEEDRNPGLFYLRAVGIMLLIVCLFLALIFLGRIGLKALRRHRMTTADRMVEEYLELREMVMRFRKEKNLPMRESLMFAAERTRDRGFETPEPEYTLSLWYALRYGGKEDADEKELAELMTWKKALKKSLGKKGNRERARNYSLGGR